MLVTQEIQTTVATLVERGAVAESEIVAVLQEILPPQLQQLIPEEMKAVAVQRPEVVQQQAQEAEYEEPPLSAEQLKNSQTGELQSMLQAHCKDYSHVVSTRLKLRCIGATVELSC